jgi:hypothetical protein
MIPLHNGTEYPVRLKFARLSALSEQYGENGFRSQPWGWTGSWPIQKRQLPTRATASGDGSGK